MGLLLPSTNSLFSAEGGRLLYSPPKSKLDVQENGLGYRKESEEDEIICLKRLA